MSLITYESASRQAGAVVMLRRLTEMLFIQVIRVWIEQQAETTGGWLAAMRDQPISAALGLIHQFPERGWKVEEQADAVALSRSEGKPVLVLIWDNASWHVSKLVRTWLRQHNQKVLQEAQTGKAGVRIIPPCWLPIKSPWLNRIEPKWVHGKRAIVEPARLLTASEARQRVCDYFGCEPVEPLTQQIS